MATKARTPSPNKARKSGKPRTPASHPAVEVMVKAAITALKDRRGSSLRSIKKYISANYKVDMARTSPFIRSYLIRAVSDNTLKQTSGTGASGRFRFAKVPKVKTPERTRKPKKPAKSKKITAKKAKRSANITIAKALKPKRAKKAALKAKAGKSKLV